MWDVLIKLCVGRTALGGPPLATACRSRGWAGAKVNVGATTRLPGLPKCFAEMLMLRIGIVLVLIEWQYERLCEYVVAKKTSCGGKANVKSAALLSLVHMLKNVHVP